MTQNQIIGLIAPIVTALVGFGIFDNTQAATIVTVATAGLGVVLFIADAIIRAHRAKLHGAQLELYTIGKLEALVTQNPDLTELIAVLRGKSVEHVAGRDPVQPPVAPNQPEPGDVDWEQPAEDIGVHTVQPPTKAGAVAEVAEAPLVDPPAVPTPDEPAAAPTPPEPAA